MKRCFCWCSFFFHRSFAGKKVKEQPIKWLPCKTSSSTQGLMPYMRAWSSRGGPGSVKGKGKAGKAAFYLAMYHALTGKGPSADKGKGKAQSDQNTAATKPMQRLKRMSTEDAEPTLDEEKKGRAPAIKIKKSPSVLALEDRAEKEAGKKKAKESEQVEAEGLASDKKKKKEVETEEPVAVPETKGKKNKTQDAPSADSEPKKKKQKNPVPDEVDEEVAEEEEEAAEAEEEEEAAETEQEEDAAEGEEEEEAEAEGQDAEGEGEEEEDGNEDDEVVEPPAVKPVKKLVGTVEERPLVRLRTKTSAESLPSPAAVTPQPKKVIFSPEVVKEIPFSPKDPPAAVSSFLGLGVSHLYTYIYIY